MTKVKMMMTRRRSIALFLTMTSGTGLMIAVGHLDEDHDEGQNQGPPPAAEASPAQTAQSRVSPLRIALAEISGGSAEIAELQQRVDEAEVKGPWLERLGFAFLQEAAVSGDEGLAAIAEQCALAMDAHQGDEHAARLLRARALHERHRFGEARDLARIGTTQRGNPLDFATLGDALIDLGDLDGAARAYQQMVDLRPDARAYGRVAYLRFLHGDLTGAIDVAEVAVRASTPRDPVTFQWAYTTLARMQRLDGRLDPAWESVERACSVEPVGAATRMERGNILIARGDFDGAVTEFALAVDQRPLPNHLWAYAEALRAADLPAAAAKIEDELQRTGRQSDPRGFALFLARRGRSLDLAQALIDDEIASRQDVYTHAAVAEVSFANGDLETAKHHLDLAVLPGTADPRFALLAAEIHLALGATDDAARYAEIARARPFGLLPSEIERLERLPLG